MNYQFSLMKISMMNSWLKILQIDISTQLTKKIPGIPYLWPYPGQEAFPPDTNPSVKLPYNNLSGI